MALRHVTLLLSPFLFSILILGSHCGSGCVWIIHAAYRVHRITCICPTKEWTNYLDTFLDVLHMGDGINVLGRGNLSPVAIHLGACTMPFCSKAEDRACCYVLLSLQRGTRRRDKETRNICTYVLCFLVSSSAFANSLSRKFSTWHERSCCQIKLFAVVPQYF